MWSVFIHRYLLDRSTWSQCLEPQHVVEWNVSLFSILLALGGIEFILCLIQVINGLLGGICGYCCTHHQVRTCEKRSQPGPGVVSYHNAPSRREKGKIKRGSAYRHLFLHCRREALTAFRFALNNVSLNIVAWLPWFFIVGSVDMGNRHP